MVAVKFICLCKRLNQIKDVETIMNVLDTLKKTFFFEKLINLTLNEKANTPSHIIIISGTQLEQIFFSCLLDFWINFPICYETSIENANQS